MCRTGEREAASLLMQCGVGCSAPLLPVTTGMLRGVLRMLKMFAFWKNGTIKCVPSPDGIVSTFCLRRSKMTALSPPHTAEETEHTVT